MQTPKFIKGGLSVDDRGQLSFINDFDFKDVKRFYIVENHHPGFIRAWHGHEKEAKYVMALTGAALVGAVKLNSDEQPTMCALSETEPGVFYIPKGYANGFKTLKPNTKLIFYSTTTLEESKGDDIRFPWNQWDVWQEMYR